MVPSHLVVVELMSYILRHRYANEKRQTKCFTVALYTVHTVESTAGCVDI